MRLFKKEPKAEQLKVIIIGAGEVGYHIAQRLTRENKQVVVIDQQPEALKRVAEALDVQTIQGSGSSPVVLHDAGAEEADIILAVTDSDEINIIACLFANIISPDSTKLARIRNEEYSLYRDALAKDILNISMLINPEVEVVKNIDRLLSLPGAVDYSEFAGGRIRMVGMRICSGPLAGIRLMNFRTVVPDGDVIIAAIVRNDELIIPTGMDEIRADDVVYFVCTESSLEAVRSVVAALEDPIQSALIIGGGNIGMRLASLFERKGYHTKLIDKDEARCGVLAEKLNSTLVLYGDGTDQDLLREENAGTMDAVISLTSDEETNILCSLLAKNMGVRKTVARINKVAYQPLVRAIGIEHSVSPRLSAVNSILHYIRKGKVLSSVAIRGEEAEVMEALAEEQSEVVGTPLHKLSFPKGALILAMVRGDDVVIPSGDTVIEPMDRILILSTRQAVSDVEQALMVKLKAY
ncbi:Trk system potassium transporter TrkA [Oleidesulfovibrio sp.]|uniref:Trk system potassium transporter TrkA n=1 Tax=Oleidesulfovibrio sp. TaxID=2909707 RepID=UPI003A848C95